MTLWSTYPIRRRKWVRYRDMSDALAGLFGCLNDHLDNQLAVSSLISREATLLDRIDVNLRMKTKGPMVRVVISRHRT